MIFSLWHFSVLFAIFPAFAQLSLPDPPYLPPSSSSGTQPSSSSRHQWSTLLGNVLYFYEAQRSGPLPHTNRVSWRNDSCTEDGRQDNFNLSGGYYDAGNFIKATFPLSFSLMSICWGATDFGQGYDNANQTAYLDDMLRWGLDWLMTAHVNNEQLVVQVGDNNYDNAYWGGDQGIPSNRPSYFIDDKNPGTDAAAGAAAAFAACSALYSSSDLGRSYSPASLQNQTYATTLLDHARHLYDFALNASGGQRTYQTSVSAVEGSYPSSSYTDELVAAGLFLALASGSSSFYAEAESNYKKFSLKGQNVVFNWDSQTPGLAVLFAQISRSDSGIGGDFPSWQSECERYFDHILDSGFQTPGGLLFYDGDSDSASLNPALNAAMLLIRYAPMASSDDKRERYLAYAQSQVDYALGKNPMSVPYVVGSNPNSPSNPHSAMASGGNDIGNIDSSPVEMAYVLYGAVIGGPDKQDNFYDIRSDWPQTEVALDYSAPMLTLAAMKVLANDGDPYFTRPQAGEYDKVKPSGTPCDAVFKCADGPGPELPLTAQIVMGVILGVVGTTILGLIAWYILTVRKY